MQHQVLAVPAAPSYTSCIKGTPAQLRALGQESPCPAPGCGLMFSLGCCDGCPARSSGNEQCFSFQLRLSRCLLLGQQGELPVPLIHGNTSSLPDREGRCSGSDSRVGNGSCVQSSRQRAAGLQLSSSPWAFPYTSGFSPCSSAWPWPARHRCVSSGCLCLVSLFLAGKANFLFILMDFFKSWLCTRIVSALLQGDGPGRARVSAVGSTAMGLGLWESRFVLDWGWCGQDEPRSMSPGMQGFAPWLVAVGLQVVSVP